MLTRLRPVGTRVGRLLESRREVAENLVASFERTRIRKQDWNAVASRRPP